MVTIKNPDTMKTTIGILCIVAPVVLAYWDIISPAIKNFITNQKTTAK